MRRRQNTISGNLYGEQADRWRNPARSVASGLRRTVRRLSGHRWHPDCQSICCLYRAETQAAVWNNRRLGEMG